MIMMHTWFEVKIRYEKVMENGMNKKVTEPYLFDSLSFTESEGRCIEEMTPFISGEFTVSDIKRANYSEIFFSDEEILPVSICSKDRLIKSILKEEYPVQVLDTSKDTILTLSLIDMLGSKTLKHIIYILLQ